MNCAKTRDLLGMYLDGEVQPRHRGAIREHLEACESCRAELASVSSLSAQLAALPTCEPDEAFYRRLFQRLWEERQPARPGARYVWQAALAAAAMLALFFSLRPPAAPVEQVGNPTTAARRVAAITQPAVPESPTASRALDVTPTPQTAGAAKRRASAAGADKQTLSPARPRRVRAARRLVVAQRPAAPESPDRTKPPEPTPEQVAAVSDALLRLTTAAEETGSALHRAVALQAKRQISARETLETAFSAFAASPVTKSEVPESHEL